MASLYSIHIMCQLLGEEPVLFTLLPTLSQVPDRPDTSHVRLVPVDFYAVLIRTLNSPHLFTGA